MADAEFLFGKRFVDLLHIQENSPYPLEKRRPRWPRIREAHHIQKRQLIGRLDSE